MTRTTVSLSDLRRPGILVRAARVGAQTLSRQPRIPAVARRPVDSLLAEEDSLNAARLALAAEYSPSRHVEVLAALLHAAGPSAPT